MLWLPDPIKELHENKDVSGLLKVLGGPGGVYLRCKAAEALADLGDPKALPKLEELLLAESDESVCAEIADTLVELKWQPGTDTDPLVRAWCAYSCEDFDACVQCGEAGRVPLIRAIQLTNRKAMKAYVDIGLDGLPSIFETIDSLMGEAISISDAHGGLDLGDALGDVLAGTAKDLVRGLKWLILTIGMYHTPEAELFLSSLYDRIKDGIQTQYPAHLMLLSRAVELRKAVASAAVASGGTTGLDLAVRIMQDDPEETVWGEVVSEFSQLESTQLERIKRPDVIAALEVFVNRTTAALKKDPVDGRQTREFQRENAQRLLASLQA